MKIKRKVQKNLPQLIEWGFEKGVHGVQFKSDRGKRVGFRHMGYFWTEYKIDKDELFTIITEEEIDENTEFKSMVEVTTDDLFAVWENASISTWKSEHSKEFHAYIGGEFKLIWTHEKGLVE